jgi:beta-lactamase class A
VQPGATSERRLRSALTALLADLPGRYTIRVHELDGGRRDVSIGGSTSRYPASTSKLFIAYGVYTRIDQGRLALTSKVRSGLTVSQCLRAMIEPSDNYCADDLRAKVGTAWLNAFLQEKGYPGTRFLAGTEKTTTASDTARLLTRLARGTLLSRASTARLLGQLKTQVWREAIPPALPKGTVQASKPGTKMRSTGMVQTDAAIVWGARTRYVIAVFGSHGATIPSITRIARQVQTRLQGKVVDPFVYSRWQMRTTASVVLRDAPGGALVASYGAGSRVEVIDSARTWYLVRIGTKVGWVRNATLVLRNPLV